MLPLPRFELHAPTSIDEVVRLLRTLGPDTHVLGGGTDLVPNMKHGLVSPRHVVSLQSVASLRGIEFDGYRFRIGAMTTLAAVGRDGKVAEAARALGEAARSVGGPHHRRMGTLGGNLCLDTRCRYFNQTHFWRDALGYCLKKDGSVCHVVAGGRNCVAAASNDTATALIALDGSVRANERTRDALGAGEELLHRRWNPKHGAGGRRDSHRSRCSGRWGTTGAPTKSPGGATRLIFRC